MTAADRALRCRLGDRVPGTSRPVASLEAEAWHRHGRLAIMWDDRRLTWPEREFLKSLGERLFGGRK